MNPNDPASVSHKFNWNSQDYTANQNFNVDEHCNAVLIINKGNTRLTVNNIILMPSPLNVNPGDRYAGESIVLGGHIGERYKGNIIIQFDPAGTDPFVSVGQKYYVL